MGWSAHRIEELINVDKIIRPSYMGVAENRVYRPSARRGIIELEGRDPSKYQLAEHFEDLSFEESFQDPSKEQRDEPFHSEDR